jgi:hypothetical protein
MVSKFQPQSVPESLLPESRMTRLEPDPRLAAEDRVFGLALEGASVAWPLKSFGDGLELRRAKLGGQDALILWDGHTKTAAAYAPAAEGEASGSVTLAVDASDPEAPWVDQETSSRWSITGRAVSGPRKGQTLRWLPGVMVKWYAWASEYPKTMIEDSPGSR